MRLTFALAIVFTALAAAAPARADCVSDRVASTHCDSESNASGECGRRLNQCYINQCNQARTVFGAIAFGQDSQAYGFSFDMPNVHDQLLGTWQRLQDRIELFR
jgi:hypothetical protein